MLKKDSSNESLVSLSVSNVGKNRWQYYIPILILLISIIIVDIFIYRNLINFKEEKEAAFAEGSEVAVKSLIENDLQFKVNSKIFVSCIIKFLN